MCENSLIDKVETLVRFSDVDSLSVVWHGHYVKFMEDGRESFGNKYGLHYLDFIANNLVTPIVSIELEYKKFLKYGDSVIIETKYVDSDASKVKFEYVMTRKSDSEIVATGKSVQVFLDTRGELILSTPDFFLDWKKKWGII